MRRSTASVDQLLDAWRRHGPRAAARVIRGRARRRLGRWLLTNQYPNEVVWGRDVQLRGRVHIRGQGTIVLGDGVILDGSIDPVALVASFPSSRLEIGARSRLSGSVVIAAGEVRIGEGTILAPCRIMDNDWHRTDGARVGAGALVAPAPVVIGDNVWIAVGSMVMRGVRIGDDAVVGAGTVVRSDVAAGAVVLGNPQRVVQTVPGRDDPVLIPPLAVRSVDAPIDLARIVSMIEDATQSIPGTIHGETRLDDPDLWDSLSVLELLEQLSAETDVELRMDELATCVTPAQLLDEVERRSAAR